MHSRRSTQDPSLRRRSEPSYQVREVTAGRRQGQRVVTRHESFGSSRGKHKSSTQSTNAVIDAAAMQDHLLRKFNLSMNHKPVARPTDFDIGQPQKSSSLTLAQRRGLVARPPPKLTEDEWKSVHNASRTRHDSTKPCPICRESFGADEQVLLSCSHVFHKACLASYEKFAGSRKCPLCRKEDYQKRNIKDGFAVHQHHSATRIQAAFRGFVERKKYLKYLETHPPTDPQRRQAFYMKKLTKTTDMWLRQVERSRMEVDDLFDEIDRSVAQSRSIMGTDWDSLYKKALARGDDDCPICMGGFAADESRSRCLLSCSHMFHLKCIEAFEGFCKDGLTQCPVCRAYYHDKKTI
eukprot:Rmarinus@m.13999